MRKRGQADRDRFTFAAKVGESQREECAYRAVKVIVGGVKLCIQQVARGDAVDRRVGPAKTLSASTKSMWCVFRLLRRF